MAVSSKQQQRRVLATSRVGRTASGSAAHHFRGIVSPLPLSSTQVTMDAAVAPNCPSALFAVDTNAVRARLDVTLVLVCWRVRVPEQQRRVRTPTFYLGGVARQRGSRDAATVRAPEWTFPARCVCGRYSSGTVLSPIPPSNRP